MSRYPQLRSASLPALWAVQRHYGWCTPEGIRQAAAVMGVTPAYLSRSRPSTTSSAPRPVGRHQVLVCHNISCWLRGADDLLDAFCEAAGADAHEADHGGASSPDGEVYVKGFECLGACDIAPMASIDERYYGPLTPATRATAVEQLRAGAEPLPDKALARRPRGRRARAASPIPAVERASRRCLRPACSSATSTSPGWPRSRRYRRLGGYRALERALPRDRARRAARQLEDSGLRGRGGAGFSMGKKASFLPARRDGEVPVLQRRRVRARHVQGPRADVEEPAPADRGDRDRGAGGRAPATRSSSSAASTRRSPTSSTAPSPRPTRRATSARTSSAPATGSSSSSTAAPAPTSAARRRRCSTRSRASAATRGSSRRSPRSRASTAGRR